MYDQNFYEGAGVVDGEGGNGERRLKWGGGPWGGGVTILGRSIKIKEIEDRSGSANPIQSTSKIETDLSLPDFYYRSSSIPLDHIEVLQFSSSAQA